MTLRRSRASASSTSKRSWPRPLPNFPVDLPGGSGKGKEERKAPANGVAPPVRAPGGRNDLEKGAARVAYARGRNAVGTATSQATVTAAGPVTDLQPDPVLAARAETHLQPSSTPVA